MFLKVNKTFSENKLRRNEAEKEYAEEGNSISKQHNE